MKAEFNHKGHEETQRGFNHRGHRGTRSKPGFTAKDAKSAKEEQDLAFGSKYRSDYVSRVGGDGLEAVLSIPSCSLWLNFRVSSVPSVVNPLCVPSCPLWLMFFEDGGEETIAGMNAGNRPQKVAANQIVDVLPHEFAGLLQTEQLSFYRNDLETGRILW